MTNIIKLREHPEWSVRAAAWFHEKWQVPEAAYLESIEDCIKGGAAVPQWYLALEGERIQAGAGVIENDFHARKDLAPNLCALYVEPDCRCRGLAGRLLKEACKDMGEMGIPTLYLVTDHTSFYERYGWEFVTMVQEEEGGEIRLYRKDCKGPWEPGIQEA